MEFIMPTDKELQYREAMVAYSIKRSETISEEELASAELRNQLVPWVVRLHSRSNFKFSTLYQAVRLVDRYLSLRTPPSELYQTIGATALFMAAKLEETMTSYALREWMIKLSPITLEALVDMENEMLVCLDYNIVTPNTFTFFELAATYFNLSRRVHCLALYLLELTLLDSKYLRYNCNLLAVSAIYLSLKLLDPSCWNEVLSAAYLGGFACLLSEATRGQGCRSQTALAALGQPHHHRLLHTPQVQPGPLLPNRSHEALILLFLLTLIDSQLISPLAVRSTSHSKVFRTFS